MIDRQRPKQRVCTALAVLLAAIYAPCHGSVAAAEDGHPKTQFGVSSLISYGTSDPLINVLKHVGTAKLQWQRSLKKKPELNFSQLVEQGLYDTQLRAFCGPLPDGSRINLGLIRGAARRAPEYYAGRWVITWKGDADLAIRLGGRDVSVSPNRIEFIAKPRDNWTSVNIIEIRSGCVSDIRVFRAEDEKLIANGQTFRPHFLDFVGAYDVVRTMGWFATNNSHIRSVDQLAHWNAPYWGAKARLPMLNDGPFTYEPSKRPINHLPFAGAPLKLPFRLARDAGVAVWINVPPMIGRPSFPGDVDWGDRKAYNYIQSTKVPEIAQATLSSLEWRRYADAVVAELIAEDYPTNKMLYLEIGNEIWNWAGPFQRHTGHFQGLGLYLRKHKTAPPRGKPHRIAYGYVSAMFAEHFAQALEDAGRQQEWTMVIATHTPWPQYSLKPALEGMAWYNRATAKNPEPSSRFGYSTTTYWSGGFHYKKDNRLFGDVYKTSKAWTERWMAEFKSDPKALARRITEYLSDTSPEGYLGKKISTQRRNQAIAQQYGVKFVGAYEGSSHDDLRDKQMRRSDDVLAFYKAWMRSDEAARVQKAMNDAMLEFAPDALTTNFVRCLSQQGPYGPWAELNDPSDSTPLSRYWDEFVRQ